MAKPSNRTAAYGVAPPFRAAPDEEFVVSEARVNQGMITSIDGADIPPAALQNALNLRIRLDKTRVRAGTEIFTPAPPDALPVLAFFSHKTNLGSAYTLRFVHNAVYKRLGNAWQLLSGSLNGDDSDRFRIITAFNQVIFSNNGIDPIKQVDVAVNTYTNLGNAPRYKYITGFYNRVVGFNLAAPVANPVQIGWSGDFAMTEWDPLNNFSAGNTTIVESPTDLSDFITGGIGFANVMVIFREKSIWLATKNPSATNPFNMFTAVPGKGCTSPNSIVSVAGGLAWVDPRTHKVYYYSPGMQSPEDFGGPIEKDLFSAIKDPDAVYGSYDTREDEIAFAIPSVGSNTTRNWIFNRLTNSWTYDERLNQSCISDVETLAAEIHADDLVGMADDLTGVADDLSGPIDSATIRLYGFNDGTAQKETETSNSDAGVPFLSRATSKNVSLPQDAIGVQRIVLELDIKTPSTITLFYSKDVGTTWIAAKTEVYTTLGLHLFVYQRHVRTRKFTWKIESSAGVWDLIDYSVVGVKGGKKVK